jgi:hypothetical protein
MYRLAEDIRWIGTLIEEPKIRLTVRDLPGKDRVRELLSQDKLARDIVESLLQASGPLTLRQISTEAGAWAIEVKSRLNQLIDEGLVLKRDLGYMPNRKTASETIKEVNI